MDPLISVIMACHNVEHYVGDAIRTACRQTLASLEVIVVDDASTDGTLTKARDQADADRRVRLIAQDAQRGPAAARNTALAAARGQWIAILDGDDLMHPTRFERLLGLARNLDADMIADDLLVFEDRALARSPRSFLGGDDGGRPRRVALDDYIRSNVLFGRRPALGYLKPLIRRDVLTRYNIRYDEGLRIGEDYDLALRLLASGAQYWIAPLMLYFYRRRATSTSFRIRPNDLVALLAADDKVWATGEVISGSVCAAVQERRRSLLLALSFDNAAAALKAGRWGVFGRAVVVRPAIVPVLAKAAVEGMARRLLAVFARLRRSTPSDDGKRSRAVIISRQRITGANNGSSAYLLSLAAALRGHGLSIDLLCPSALVLGRWPFLRVGPEMQVFDSIRIRGCLRIGRYFLSLRPFNYAAASAVLVERALARLGLPKGALNLKRAPYAIAAPWSVRDLLYLAAHVRPAEMLIADYSFQAAALPYALLPQARTFVVMHDLFFRRTEQFRERGATDSVAVVSEHEELAMLGLADVVIAIQQDEAAHVRRCLPRQRVVVAPMATHVIATPQPGTVPALLFIGSSAAPNVLGLRWFLASIWPRIRTAHPAAELWVVGGVCHVVDAHDPKVRFFGMVQDLGRIYREAAVVVCPLTVGSGLKIKLIEALGWGKAIVATSVAVEGVSEWVQPAVAVEDAPERFAAEVVALLSDPALRRERAEGAHAVAADRFSPDACYRDLLAVMAHRRAGGRLDSEREMPVDVCDP